MHWRSTQRQPGIGGVLPEAEGELGDIGNMLSGLMFEAGTSSGMSLNFDNVNEDASKILCEAATVAEQRVSANFPDLPPGMPGAANKSKTQKHKLPQSFLSFIFIFHCFSNSYIPKTSLSIQGLTWIHLVFAQNAMLK